MSLTFVFSNQNNLEDVTETIRVHVMIIAMIAVTEVGKEITDVILIGIVATEKEMTIDVAAVIDVLEMMIGTEKWKDTADVHVITTMIILADHVHVHQEVVTINIFDWPNHTADMVTMNIGLGSVP